MQCLGVYVSLAFLTQRKEMEFNRLDYYNDMLDANRYSCIFLYQHGLNEMGV